jgi:PAS domain S-box-containing protein
MEDRHRILIVEDMAFDAELIERALREAGLLFETRRVETAPDLIAALQSFRPDVVLSDFNLPRLDGMTALRHVREQDPHLPFLLVTGSLNEETAVECMKAGAADYVLKDRMKRIGPAVRAALAQKAAHAAKFTAERALRESERRYRTLVDSLSEVVFQTDAKGAWTFLNPAWTEITGFAVDESLGRTLVDFIHPQDREGQLAALGRLVDRGENVFRGSFRCIRKGGGERWVEGFARFHRGPDGELTGAAGTANDITDRKRAEAEQERLRDALRESVLEWQRTFDAMDFPVLIADVEGRVSRLNRAGRDLLGQPFAAIIGRQVKALSHAEPWRAAARLVQQVAASDDRAEAQVNDAASGQVFSLTARPLGGLSPEQRRIIVDARNVTREIEMQESLRRSELLSAMGSLVAGVAHEVRNPLFSISSNIDAFEAQTGSVPEYARTVGVLRSEVARLSSLMQDLLDYGRPPTAEREVLPLEGVLQEEMHRCAHLAHKAQVDLAATSPFPHFVAMDRTRLGLVFRNLFENAIQHAPAGSSVRVEVEGRADGGREAVVVSVNDSGPGFREEDIPVLFTPFFTRRRGGTGMGLSIVQKVVLEHGGEVTARNLPGGGGSIRVSLPCTTPGAPAGGAA